jgi:hypothetical protein
MIQAETETAGARSRRAVVGGMLVLAGAAAFLAAGSPLDAPFRLLVAAPGTIADEVTELRGPTHLAGAGAVLVAIGGLLASTSARGAGAARALTITAGLLAGVGAISELRNVTGMWASLSVISRSEAVPKPADVQAAAEAGATLLAIGHGALLACGGCLVMAGLLRAAAPAIDAARVLSVAATVPAAFLLCAGWLLVCLHAAALVRLVDDSAAINAGEVVAHTRNMLFGGIAGGVGLGCFALALVLRGVVPGAAISDDRTTSTP